MEVQTLGRVSIECGPKGENGGYMTGVEFAAFAVVGAMVLGVVFKGWS